MWKIILDVSKQMRYCNIFWEEKLSVKIKKDLCQTSDRLGRIMAIDSFVLVFEN